MYFWPIIIILLLGGAFWAVAGRLRRRCRRLDGALAKSRREYRELSDFLAQMTSGLQEDTGFADAMHSVARHLADQLGAEAVAVYEFENGVLTVSGVAGLYPLVRTGNRLILTKPHHLFEALKREPVVPGTGFLGEVAALKRPELISSATNDPRFADYPDSDRLGSIMAVPLLREPDHSLLGVICAVNNRQGRQTPFSEEQFARLQSMEPQAIIVRDLMQAYSRNSRQQRIDQELDFARRVQYSLLPPSFPSWNQFSVTAFTRSLKEVNGDYYDFVEIDSDRLLIVIGDACGKGIPACMMAAMVRSMVRALAENFTNLTDFLRSINRKMQQNTEADSFITLGCCLLDRKNLMLEYGRAGHTELLTYVRHHIRVIEPNGMALGALPDEFANFDTICLSFEPGMAFLMFSDGLTEAVNEQGEEFGLPRLKEAFRRAGDLGDAPDATIQRILDAVHEFAPEAGDDQTLILIRHSESSVPAPAGI